MRANAIEAAEQCGILTIPTIADEVRFDRLIGAWDPERTIIFCDERAETQNPLLALDRVKPGPVAVLIGPEGGLDDVEFAVARAAGFRPWSLGPRVLRAETAPVAALAILQHRWGDL